MDELKIKGRYIPISDGYGTVGYTYVCPECRHETDFANCEEGCEKCEFSEPYVDPDDWHDYQMSLPVNERAWNKK